MKHYADFLCATNTEISTAISEHISGRNAERDRKILRRRLIDGITYERLAEEYAKCAVECRAEHPKLSAKLHELASEEMNHMRQLHGEVTKIIEEYKVKNGEPPKEMLAIYNYEHKKQISRAAVIKQLIAEYQ